MTLWNLDRINIYEVFYKHKRILKTEKDSRPFEKKTILWSHSSVDIDALVDECGKIKKKASFEISVFWDFLKLKAIVDHIQPFL